jgi:hypothetical protein
MGYGEQEDSVTYFRPALVFANDHLTVDDQALNDMQLSHIELPKATIDEVASCDTEVWLIPKHEAPFALVNDYSMLAPRSFPTRPLFPPQFRDAFVRTYQKETSTEFFDVWRCRRSHSTTSP